MSDFGKEIAAAYATTGASIEVGKGVLDGKVVTEADVRLPLRSANRHGLIAGATGTGKTRTLQLLAEQLSEQGVPVFAADVKGDLSGIAAPGDGSGPAGKRAAELGEKFEPTGFPAEYLSLGGVGPGVPIRATVSDFGPQLLAKVLESNDTQEQSLSLVFRYADTKGLPLLDLSDLRALLTFLDSDAGKAELSGIGGVASQTIGVLLRSLAGLEDGGGNELFGEPQFDVNDLLRTTSDGRGVISCLELPAVQDKPRLFSTALMWLLAELFEALPEVGDLEKPKLVFFFDEAHLLFDDTTKAFLESVTQTVRLIRSKGVGVFFITQAPKDIHEDVLAQLGNRVQHALRAFTPDDEGFARDGTHVSEVRVLQARGAAPAARHRRGGRHGSSPRAACRLRSCTRRCKPRAREWARQTTSRRPRRSHRSLRSTRPGSTASRPASCSRHGSKRPRRRHRPW